MSETKTVKNVWPHVRLQVLTRLWCVLLASSLLFIGCWFTQVIPVYAQSAPSLQIISGVVEPGAPLFFDLPTNLQQGDVLQMSASRLSGNLDPFIGIIKGNTDLPSLTSQLETGYESAVQDGQDPLEVIATLANEYFVAWDDDGGPGYGSTLKFSVPESDNYKVLVTNSPFTNSFGTVQLALSINEDEPLDDLLAAAINNNLEIESLNSSDSILRLEETSDSLTGRAEERIGTLSSDRVRTFFTLDSLQQGQILYADVESIDGTFNPRLSL